MDDLREAINRAAREDFDVLGELTESVEEIVTAFNALPGVEPINVDRPASNASISTPGGTHE